MLNAKRVLHFHEGNAGMKMLLGGKGANLAEMTNAGLPVPPGYTITTEACRQYYAGGGVLPEGLWTEIRQELKQIELKKTSYSVVWTIHFWSPFAQVRSTPCLA